LAGQSSDDGGLQLWGAEQVKVLAGEPFVVIVPIEPRVPLILPLVSVDVALVAAHHHFVRTAHPHARYRLLLVLEDGLHRLLAVLQRLAVPLNSVQSRSAVPNLTPTYATTLLSKYYMPWISSVRKISRKQPTTLTPPL